MQLNAHVTNRLLGRGNTYVMDEETLNILTTERKLIAMGYLAIGEMVGKGNFGSVYKGSLQLPDQDRRIDVAVKTLKSHCKLFKLNFKLLQDFDTLLVNQGFSTKTWTTL